MQLASKMEDFNYTEEKIIMFSIGLVEYLKNFDIIRSEEFNYQVNNSFDYMILKKFYDSEIIKLESKEILVTDGEYVGYWFSNMDSIKKVLIKNKSLFY